MKKIFLFLSVSLFAAVSFTSCKAKVETNYVDLILGRWHVDSVFPELPDKKYFVDGDEFVLNEDMTLELDNNWRGYFTSTSWTLALDMDQNAYYLTMMGTHNEEEYGILFARISGITETQMFLEYTDESTGSIYRFSLSRVE